jgi:hypothetical protein
MRKRFFSEVLKLDILDEYLGDTMFSITKTNINEPMKNDTTLRIMQ